MKTGEMTKKGLYIGTGAGLVLFAIIGLLYGYGPFLGGVIGLNIAGNIFGTPLGPSVMPRLIVAASMVLGTFIVGVVLIVGTSLLGWFIGYAVDAVRESRAASAEAAKEKNS
ncbi:MAG: hypothetical protein HY754_05200 [Nitrospirae bacterium]|nr:hypothetical protein [Nitrospirota bacterium]